MYQILPPGTEPEPLVAERGRLRSGVVVLVLVVAAFAAVAAILAMRDDEPGAPLGVAQDAACGAVVDVPAEAGAPEHRNGRIDYDESPPTSGDHSPMPHRTVRRVLSAETDNAVEGAVHNLEHGYVVVWYDPGVTPPGEVEAALEGLRERKVIAAPWNRGGMGEARPYVLAAWGHRQDCTGLSAAAVNAFYAEHGGPNGDAPEKDAA